MPVTPLAEGATEVPALGLGSMAGGLMVPVVTGVAGASGVVEGLDVPTVLPTETVLTVLGAGGQGAA